MEELAEALGPKIGNHAEDDSTPWCCVSPKLNRWQLPENGSAKESTSLPPQLAVAPCRACWISTHSPGNTA